MEPAGDAVCSAGFTGRGRRGTGGPESRLRHGRGGIIMMWPPAMIVIAAAGLGHGDRLVTRCDRLMTCHDHHGGGAGLDSGRAILDSARHGGQTRWSNCPTRWSDCRVTRGGLVTPAAAALGDSRPSSTRWSNRQCHGLQGLPGDERGSRARHLSSAATVASRLRRWKPRISLVARHTEWTRSVGVG